MNWFRYLRTSNRFEQRIGSARYQKGGHENNLVAAAIDRLTNQIKAAVREEKSEDDKSTFRDKVTISLIFLTFIAASCGDWIFYRTMGDARATAAIQHTDTISTLNEDERAWVGPTDASLDVIPNKTDPLTIKSTYGNFGREPALGVTDYVGFLIINAEEVTGGISPNLDASIITCRNTHAIDNGSVAWPTATGENNFILFNKLDNSPFQSGIEAGNNVLAIVGCFAYQTIGTTRHTAFCYYFQPGVSEIAHLTICRKGNYAD